MDLNLIKRLIIMMKIHIAVCSQSWSHKKMSTHFRIKLLPLALMFGMSTFGTITSGAQADDKAVPQTLETPRFLPRVENLGRAPLNQYGSLETTIQTMRS